MIVFFPFRSIFDGMSNVMAARSMKWELDAIYPGLKMRVGPYHGMNSVLEFVLDEQEADTSRKAFYASDHHNPPIGKLRNSKRERGKKEVLSPIAFSSRWASRTQMALFKVPSLISLQAEL